jgi:hypothetical protein
MEKPRCLFLLPCLLLLRSSVAAGIITPHIPHFLRQTKPFVIRDPAVHATGAPAVAVTADASPGGQVVRTGLAYRIPSADLGGGCYYGNLELAGLPAGTDQLVYGATQRPIAIGGNGPLVEAAAGTSSGRSGTAPAATSVSSTPTQRA